MKSPFQYGTLVDKESFVNRVEERKQLKELLGSGINVMLISPRRWGKSSLVKVAMDELTQEDINAWGCASFARRTSFAVSAAWIGQPPCNSLIFFSGSCCWTKEPRLQSGIKRILSLLSCETILTAEERAHVRRAVHGGNCEDPFS